MKVVVDGFLTKKHENPMWLVTRSPSLRSGRSRFRSLRAWVDVNEEQILFSSQSPFFTPDEGRMTDRGMRGVRDERLVEVISGNLICRYCMRQDCRRECLQNLAKSTYKIH